MNLRRKGKKVFPCAVKGSLSKTQSSKGQSSCWGPISSWRDLGPHFMAAGLSGENLVKKAQHPLSWQVIDSCGFTGAGVYCDIHLFTGHFLTPLLISILLGRRLLLSWHSPFQSSTRHPTARHRSSRTHFPWPSHTSSQHALVAMQTRPSFPYSPLPHLCPPSCHCLLLPSWLSSPWIPPVPSTWLSWHRSLKICPSLITPLPPNLQKLLITIR